MMSNFLSKGIWGEFSFLLPSPSFSLLAAICDLSFACCVFEGSSRQMCVGAGGRLPRAAAAKDGRTANWPGGVWGPTSPHTTSVTACPASSPARVGWAQRRLSPGLAQLLVCRGCLNASENVGSGLSQPARTQDAFPLLLLLLLRPSPAAKTTARTQSPVIAA